jgi:fumarate reductase subunit D
MYAKAIAALITPLIVTLLMPLGLNETSTVAQVVEAIVVAVSTAVAVYFIPNQVK